MASTSQLFISSATLQSVLSHQSLIHHFQTSLLTVSSAIQTPIRQHHAVSPSSSLLLMPSWSSSPSLPYIGVKLVTHFPQNSAANLPGIHANYFLFSSTTGQPLASMYGTQLTLYRTSFVFGLASKLLARNNSKTLVMIGVGAYSKSYLQHQFCFDPRLGSRSDLDTGLRPETRSGFETQTWIRSCDSNLDPGSNPDPL